MTTYRDAVLSDSPSYYWGLDDAIGSATYASAVPGGPTLAPSGTILLRQPALALGDAGTCAKFSVGQAISSKSEQAPNIFALEAIISTTAASGYIMGHSSGGSYDRMLYVGSSGRLVFALYDTTARGLIGSSVVADGKPHHVVGRVANGGVVSVWVDGLKQGEVTLGPSFFAYVAKVYIGNYGVAGYPESVGSMPFIGFIDEPAVYRGPLSDAAIARHAQIALRPSRLAGKATLDTGSPASRVLARNWDTDAPAGTATPGVDGSWSMYVAPGNYEVSVRGPTGYQPITHGPVVAASDL